MDKVIILSENIGRFCRKQRIDKRRTHHLSLCIEEMTGNVVQHAFTDGKKHFIDIRVLIKKEQLIFRIRDDGIPFNPLEKLQEDADPCKNIGIRLVKRISVGTDYRNTIGLNNLIVKL